jgi:hypothetical protein
VALDADDRVELEQGQGRRGRAQVHLPGAQRAAHAARQRVDVDLQADAERGLRAHAGADAAVARALYRPVQLERAAPELVVAEVVEAEDLAPLAHERVRLALGGGRGGLRHGADVEQRPAGDGADRHETGGPHGAPETARRSIAFPSRLTQQTVSKYRISSEAGALSSVEV